MSDAAVLSELADLRRSVDALIATGNRICELWERQVAAAEANMVPAATMRALDMVVRRKIQRGR